MLETVLVAKKINLVAPKIKSCFKRKSCQEVAEQLVVEANYGRHDVTWNRSVLLVKTNIWMIYILFNYEKLRLILKIAAFDWKGAKKAGFLLPVKTVSRNWVGLGPEIVPGETV